MEYETIYRIAADELDAAFEAEGVTWDYHAFTHGIDDYGRDMLVGWIADAGMKAIREAVRDYKEAIA